MNFYYFIYKYLLYIYIYYESKFRYKFKKLKYTPYLELKFESNGKDSNHIIWNTLRRIVYEHIPTYAWNDFTLQKYISIK